MKKKLILTLNALLTLALFAGSINAERVLPALEEAFAEEAEAVAEKGLSYTSEEADELVATLNSSSKAIEEVEQNVQGWREKVNTYKEQGKMDKAQVQKEEAEFQRIDNVLGLAETGQLTREKIESSLKPSTIVAILTALGLITSGGVIAGYLLRAKTSQPAMQYDYKYLPQ